MFCSHCGHDAVKWCGPLSALTHTECGNCGMRDSHKPEGEQFNEVCNRDGCTGVMCMAESVDCSCHISAPCASCDRANRTIECGDCGHTIEEDY